MKENPLREYQKAIETSLESFKSARQMLVGVSVGTLVSWQKELERIILILEVHQNELNSGVISRCLLAEPNKFQKYVEDFSASLKSKQSPRCPPSKQTALP